MYEAITSILIPIASVLISAVVAYSTATYTIRQERYQGRLRLLELTRRCFMNVFNAFDPSTKTIKQDSINKKFYVEELRIIIQELQNLMANPYFSVLITRYPSVSDLLVISRWELIQHEESHSFALNISTLNEFWKLHQILSKELPKITSLKMDQDIRNLADFLKLDNI